MRILKTGPGADDRCQFCKRPKPVVWQLHERDGSDRVGWLTCCGTLLIAGVEETYAIPPRKVGGRPNHEDMNKIVREARAFEDELGKRE